MMMVEREAWVWLIFLLFCVIWMISGCYEKVNNIETVNVGQNSEHITFHYNSRSIESQKAVLWGEGDGEGEGERVTAGAVVGHKFINLQHWSVLGGGRLLGAGLLQDIHTQTTSTNFVLHL